ncbi:MAG: hypothetical protein ACLU5J_00290 [Christensenellales bacterium]
MLLLFFLLLLLVLSFLVLKEKNYSDENYIVKNDKTDTSSILYQDTNLNKTNHKLGNFFNAFYLCGFTIIWISILTTIIVLTSSENLGLMRIAFIPFILASILLIITTIKAFITAFKTKKNKIVEKHTISDEYFVKMCMNCGGELSQNDKFCPFVEKK